MTEAERIPSSDPGTALANDMIKSIAINSKMVEESIAMQAELRDSIDKLVDHCEVFTRTAEILMEKAEEGKNKWSLKDFFTAYLEAADEIMPAEEEEDEDEPDGPGER